MIYGMLKSGTAYDPGVDQLNQVDPRSKEEQAQDTERKADPTRRRTAAEPSQQLEMQLA